jgi:hypothetical protein
MKKKKKKMKKKKKKKKRERRGLGRFGGWFGHPMAKKKKKKVLAYGGGSHVQTLKFFLRVLAHVRCS